MSMAAINAALLATAAQQEAKREAVLQQLREAGATSPSSALALEPEGEEARQALAELVEAKKVHDVGGRYYVEPKPGAAKRSHTGFVLLLVLLVTASVIVSVVALLASG